MNRLIIVAAPRSGSTSLIRNAVKISGLNECPPREQIRKLPPITMFSDLYPEDWARNQPTVGKLHMRATGMNMAILHKAGVRVVYHSRNIFDSLVSLKEHHDGFPGGRLLWGDAWQAMADSERLDAIIDRYAYEYAAQHVWMGRLSDSMGIPVLSTSFEQLREDPSDLMAKILEWAGWAIDRQVIQGITAQRHNFNKGEVGRGRQIMSTDQIARVTRTLRALGPTATEFSK